MSKTIVIFSTKGGVGKTLIATNLAVSLGYYLRKKVALIDLDLQGAGDMPRWLDIRADKSMLELADALKKNPAMSSVAGELLHVEKFSIDFLPAVLKPNQIFRVDSEKIKLVLDALEKEYDYIIIDAGRAFTESLFAVFNHANLILLVVTPDILSVYQTKWSLDILQSLYIPLGMIKIVLNRAQSLGGVSWQEVRAAIPCDIMSRIPSEGKAAGIALNRRVPLVIDNLNCKASQTIRKLAVDLTEDESIFLKHHEIALSTAAGEGFFAKEGDFWKKFKLGRDAFTPEGEDKEPDEIIELKKRIHQRLIEKLDLKHLEIDMNDPAKAQAIREKTEKVITNALAEETGVFLSSPDVRKRLVKR